VRCAAKARVGGVEWRFQQCLLIRSYGRLATNGRRQLLGLDGKLLGRKLFGQRCVDQQQPIDNRCRSRRRQRLQPRANDTHRHGESAVTRLGAGQQLNTVEQILYLPICFYLYYIYIMSDIQ